MATRNIIPEASYPLDYRKEDALALATFIKNHESICLVAIKKVGISNFLRFFFYHPEVKEKYFGKEAKNFLFIYADLNDLPEVSAQSFWLLVSKRIWEAVMESDFPKDLRKEIDKIFLNSITFKDALVTFDNLRKMAQHICRQTNLSLVLFLVRFDRLKPVFGNSFFTNLQSLYDGVKSRLIYITTSVRPIKDLYPEVFSAISVATLAHVYYLPPAQKQDIERITEYLGLTKTKREEIIKLGGGHIMLTRLLAMAWQQGTRLEPENLVSDERISFACEEIWENLSQEERQFLKATLRGERKAIPKEVEFLFKTGVLSEDKKSFSFFSPLFKSWVEKNHQDKETTYLKNEFTQKEKLLWELLLAKKEEIVDREGVVAAVWPEYAQSEDLAVSDWAIDRLVSRLRKKLKTKEENYRVITLRGRGFKLAAA